MLKHMPGFLYVNVEKTLIYSQNKAKKRRRIKRKVRVLLAYEHDETTPLGT
jgi:hypothetical protein